MRANPILAELQRGNTVENIHRGAFCVAKADGTAIASAGDANRLIFPRSAIKAIQALAMFRSGAASIFGFNDEAIALACASHHGEPQHVAGVKAMLDRLGLSVDDLECGAHPPTDPAARRSLRQNDEAPSALHNNCSGKHAGMLAVARALGVPSKGYSEREHEVQKLVREGIETVIGEKLTVDHCGTDGCSIPTWAAPLDAFARGFARMATGNGLPHDDFAASLRIFDAATARPSLVRGSNSLDTELMTAFAGRLMIKVGAEGVFCGALRDKGWGFALKIDDGNMIAAETVVANLLTAISSPDAQEAAALEKYAGRVTKNWRGIEVSTWCGTELARPIISQ